MKAIGNTIGVFNGPLLTEAVGKVSQVEIDKVSMPFSFTFPLEDSKLFAYRSTVPQGFITDYASIPWLSQKVLNLLPNDPDYDQAAVLHDYLTQVRTIDIIHVSSGKVIKTEPISRKFCDDVFLNAMKSVNCPPWKRNILYSAVRVYATLTFNF